mgnify:FL=1
MGSLLILFLFWVFSSLGVSVVNFEKDLIRHESAIEIRETYKDGIKLINQIAKSSSGEDVSIARQFDGVLIDSEKFIFVENHKNLESLGINWGVKAAKRSLEAKK